MSILRVAPRSSVQGHLDKFQVLPVENPHLLDPFGQHVGAGCAKVDVEHDDADHHDHGHQHHAEEQEPVGTHSAWSPQGVAWQGHGGWHVLGGCGGVGQHSLANEGDGHGCGGQPLGDEQQEDRLGQEHCDGH